LRIRKVKNAETTITNKKKNPGAIVPSPKLERLAIASTAVSEIIATNSTVMPAIVLKIVTCGKWRVILSRKRFPNIKANINSALRKKLSILLERSQKFWVGASNRCHL
jgi:hypothetical protein